MIHIKSSEDFLKNIDMMSQTMIVYGAGYYGRKFLELGIVNHIDFFCDRRAKDIKSIAGIDVLNIDDLQKIHGLINIVICIDFTHIDYDKQLAEIYDQLRLLNIEANVYTFFDNNRLISEGTVKLGNKEFIVDDMKYIRSDPWYFNAAYNKIPYYSKSYIEQLAAQPWQMIAQNEKIVSLMEWRSKYVNHINGKRLTICHKNNASNTIHIYGDSRTSGFMNEDKYTFCSLFQNKLEKENYDYKVENYGIPGRAIERMWFQLKNSDLSENDLVFFISACHEYKGDSIKELEVYYQYIKEANKYCMEQKCHFFYINLPTALEIENPSHIEQYISKIYTTSLFKGYNLSEMKILKNILYLNCIRDGILFYDFAICFQRPHNYGEVFINLHHYGPNGNELIANKLFEIISSIKIANKGISQEIIFIKKNKDITFKNQVFKLAHEKEYKKYIMKLKEQAKENLVETGAIVMNCNPFTNGHRFLIETAAKMVPHLYIFILEEDKSEYKFHERYKLLLENTKDIKNVTVLKSGKFIISSLTFPEYFDKDKVVNNQIDISNDILLFTKEIAPALKIKKRFVGQEPYCMVTRQYNEQMKQILPIYGIELIEIERLEKDKNPISASKVRQLVKEKNYEHLKRYVSDITYKYILDKYKI